MGASTRTALWAYVAIAAATLVFQIYVQVPQCAGTAGCAISFGKGVVWSIIWPAGWFVYLKGMF
jgi:hypothetical protein